MFKLTAAIMVPTGAVAGRVRTRVPASLQTYPLPAVADWLAVIVLQEIAAGAVLAIVILPAALVMLIPLPAVSVAATGSADDDPMTSCPFVNARPVMVFPAAPIKTSLVVVVKLDAIVMLPGPLVIEIPVPGVIFALTGVVPVLPITSWPFEITIPAIALFAAPIRTSFVVVKIVDVILIWFPLALVVILLNPSILIAPAMGVAVPLSVMKDVVPVPAMVMVLPEPEVVISPVPRTFNAFAAGTAVPLFVTKDVGIVGLDPVTLVIPA